MAAGDLGTLYAGFELRLDKLNEGVEKANAILSKLEGNVEQKKEDINKTLALLGGSLSLSVTTPLTLLGKQALDTFTQFEQSLQNTFSVMGASADEMEMLKSKAEQMGATTRFSASQAADALYSLGSAGQSAAQAANSLDGVLKLAGATGSDLAFTSETIASTLSQFNLEAGKAAHIADVYSMAISKSQANMTKLSYSMKYVGPVANGLGVSLEASTAALMQLYNAGFGGEQAGTILRAGLQKLASGTDKVRDQIEALGLAYDDVNPKTNDFADVIERLRQANVDVTVASNLFGEAAAAGMAKLIEGGGEAIRTMDGILTASDGAAEKMQAIQNTSFANTKAELASAFEAVQITLTSNVIPAVDMVAKAFTHVLQVVNNLPAWLQTGATALGAFAASAGPLLMVAAGVKKIKHEMAQLNMVMKANPVFFAGAALAVLASVAAGIYAQMKKSHEEWVHGAKKGVEEVKKLQADAQKEGDTGRRIKSLFDEYTELKSKTQKTADEQSRYNELLKELSTVVPNAVSEYDKAGNALVLNEQKIGEAYEARLERERNLNKQAQALAKAKLAQADAVLAAYQGKREKADAELKSLTDKLEAMTTAHTKVEEAYTRYKKAYDSGNKKEAAAIAKEMESLYQSGGLPSGVYVDKTFTAKKLKEASDTYLASLAASIDKAQAKYQGILDAQQMQIDAQTELNALIAKGTALGEAGKQEPVKKKTRKEYADEAWDNYDKEKERIKTEQDWARVTGAEYDELSEKINVLVTQIEKLRALNEEELAGGVFTAQSAELKKLSDEIARLKDLQEKRKNAKKGGKKKEEPESLQERLDAMDSFYSKQTQDAEQYGRNIKEIEEKWYAARKKLLDDYISAQEKSGKKRAEILKEDTGKKEGGKEKDKKTGITVSEEIFKTNHIFKSNYAEYLEGIKKTKDEIEGLEQKIKEVQALIQENIKAGDLEGAENGKQYVEALKEKAQDLKKEIGLVTLSLKEIDSGLAEIERIDKSEYELKLINIENEKKRLQQVVKEAQAAGKITKQEADKKNKQIADDAQKNKRNAQVEAADPYIKMATGLANTLTDIICEGIEKGTVAAEDMAQSIGGALGQIAGAIPDPMTKAIVGTIGALATIGGKIVASMNKKVEADVKKYNKDAEEAEKKRLERIAAIAGGVTGDIAKKIYGVNKQHLNWSNIFDTEALAIEKKKADKLLKDIDTVKTTEITEKKRKRTITEGQKKEHRSGWGLFQRVLAGIGTAGLTELFVYSKKTEEEYTEKVNMEVQEVIAKMQEAKQKGNHAEAERLKKVIDATMRQEAKKRNIDLDKIDGISNYVQGLDSALAAYIKNKDMKAFKKALKKSLYEAIVQKAVFNSALKQTLANLDLVEQGKMSQKEFEASLEKMAQDAEKSARIFAKKFGINLDADAANEAAKKAAKFVDQISSALSDALADAAYNADWGSFKKAFAGEMKKAIIKSAMESTGLKAQVDAIVKNIMKDGQVTAEEVNSGIAAMQPLFDKMERVMAEAGAAAKALEGGVDVKNTNSGTIIQQLSGSDRDWFTEVFKDGFSKLNQVFELKELTVAQIQATQIIVQSMTYNFYNGTINITADKNVNLKEVLTDITKEVLQGD